MSSSGITGHGEPFTITKSSPSSDSVVKLKRLQLPYCSVVPLVRLRPNTEIPLLQAAPLGVSQRWMSKAMSVLLCPACQGLKLGREREKKKRKKRGMKCNYDNIRQPPLNEYFAFIACTVVPHLVIILTNWCPVNNVFFLFIPISLFMVVQHTFLGRCIAYWETNGSSFMWHQPCNNQIAL